MTSVMLSDAPIGHGNGDDEWMREGAASKGLRRLPPVFFDSDQTAVHHPDIKVLSTLPYSLSSTFC